MTRRPVTVVVLCWNRWDLTERCLASVRASTDLSDVEVLAVDNGSTDETPEKLRELGWVRTVRLPENLGFVRGNNAGIAAASAGHDVVLLNNDVVVRQPGWLDALRATAHGSPDVGIVGCRLALPDGRLLHAGTYILPDTLWGQQVGALEADVNQYAVDRDVEGIVFACAYLKRELIDVMGGLSTAYESYFEDTDTCLRARAAGFRTLLCGGVTLVHDEHGSTRDDPAMFDRVFRHSRAVFRRRWRRQLEARYDRSVLWQSILNFSTGYAMSCREIVRALDARGVRVAYRYVYGRGTPFPVDEPDGAGDHLLDVLSRRRAPRRPDVSVVYAQGDVFARGRGRYRIGYTMLEVDGFPAEWVRQANEMEEVWTPSAFNRDGLVASGVRRPVHVMPLGVDPNHFHPAIRRFPAPGGDFVFLSSFEWGERKQPELLLKAFNDAFRSHEPALLVCKVINRDASVGVRQRVLSLGLSPLGGRIAFLHNVELPYHQLGALYRSADCYVSAGRGEGWDMPLMEAMACGLPSIATDWGAHTEFVNEGIAYPLRVRGTVPARAKCPYYDGFSWADPDPEHLRHLLRHVYERRDEAAEKGRRAAAEMAERWTWDHAAARIRQRLDEVARAPARPADTALPPGTSGLDRVARHWGEMAERRVEQPLMGWLDSRLVVSRYVQPLQTGEPETNWLVGLSRRLGLRRDGRWLSLGCGAAGTELLAAKAGLFGSMLALDASPPALEEARRAAAAQGVASIRFELADLDRITLPRGEFDVALMCMSLHHVRELEATLEAVRQSLKPGGWLLLNEYVGPSRFQFPDRQLSLVAEALALLPERLRIDATTGKPKDRYVRLPVAHWERWDPSEAVRSAEILAVLARSFEVVERKDYGGSLLALALEHVVHNFDGASAEDLAALERLFETERRLLASGEIASDYTVVAARRRGGLDAWRRGSGRRRPERAADQG